MKIFLLLVIFSFSLMSCNRLRDRKEPTFRPSSPSVSLRGEKNARHSSKELCSNIPACVDACHEVYSFNTKEARDCQELSVSAVEDLHTAAKYLEKPTNRNIQLINEDEFHTFLSVGATTFIRYINRYRISEAKRVLSWIAEEKDIARVIFSSGPKNYEEIFLNLMRSTDPLVAEKALHSVIARGRSFYQICNNRNNNYAIYMMHQVITNDLCEIDSSYLSLDLYEVREACVLRVYCHQVNNQYIHAPDFKYISRVIEYDDIFDYVQEEDEDFGLNIQEDELTEEVCDSVCGLIPNSCM